VNTAQPDNLTAWREPEVALRDRNLALALVAAGLENGSAPEVIRGYRLLNRVAKDFPNDPALLASLGSILMKGKQPAEALKCFEKAAALKPQYAPYYLNVAAALLAEKHQEEAARQAEKALALDPLLEAAVDLLSTINQDEPLVKFDEAMGISRH
jgi:tetratricopeptide (TPR) repeat protein